MGDEHLESCPEHLCQWIANATPKTLVSLHQLVAKPYDLLLRRVVRFGEVVRYTTASILIAVANCPLMLHRYWTIAVEILEILRVQRTSKHCV